MSLWWLQPGWKAAMCGRCGVNIWDSGGDPDWGLCAECFERDHPVRNQEPPMPKCDICHQGEACADVAGVAVCSQECSDEAQKRAERGKT